MFSSFVRSLAFWQQKPQVPSLAIAPHSYNPDPDFAPSMEDVPRYPPFDKGLPFISVDELLKSQNALIERVRESRMPFAEQAVRNLAGYVHLLPATTNDFFCGAGGLFRLCLEVGFHSYVASQGNIFTQRDPAEKRRELEAKWQLAAFLAGLCCELSRAIVTSVVTNDHGERWLPFEPITGWLERSKAHRYFLRPPQSSALVNHQTAHLSGVIINAVIPSDALQHITTEDQSILMSMLSTITRMTETYNAGQFPRTVRYVRDQVINRDKRSNPLTFGKPLVGTHLEPYLINAMRHLVRNGAWKVNQKLARVHVATDGAFVFWSTGCAEVRSMLLEEGAVGIPSDHRTLGELLMREGVFEENPEGGLWWYIRTPISPTVYEVVKLTSPGLIIDDDTLASLVPYDQAIVVDAADAASQAARSEPQDADPKHQLVVHASAVHTHDPEAQRGSSHASAGTNGSSHTEHHQSSSRADPPRKKDYTHVLAITSNLPPPSNDVDATPSQQGSAPDESKVKSSTSSVKRLVSTPTSGSSKRPPAPNGHRPEKPGPASAPNGALNGQDDIGPARGPADLPRASVAAHGNGASKISAAMQKLDSAVRVHMLRFVQQHNRDPAASKCFWSDVGLCLPSSHVDATANLVLVSNQLAAAEFLHVPAGQTSKIIKQTRDGETVRCLVIKTDAAIDLGFAKPEVHEPPFPLGDDEGIGVDIHDDFADDEPGFVVDMRE